MQAAAKVRFPLIVSMTAVNDGWERVSSLRLGAVGRCADLE